MKVFGKRYTFVKDTNIERQLIGEAFGVIGDI